MSAHGDHHDKPHLPHGSIWPFFLAISMGVLGLALITLGRNMRLSNSTDAAKQALANVSLASVFFGAAIAFLFLVIIGWVREDFRWWKTNTGTGLGMARAGTLLFISSEVFIFGALFSSYFTFQRLADVWPDTEHFHLPWLKTLGFTLFLFASSATIHKSEKHLRLGELKAFKTWWLATIVLGAIFLSGQVWEYIELIHAGETLGSSQFMTSFYMLTGTHGLHVLGGLIALIIAYVRAVGGNFDEHRHAFPEAVAMYWHFVDLVWVFVYALFYLIPVFLLGA